MERSVRLTAFVSFAVASVAAFAGYVVGSTRYQGEARSAAEVVHAEVVLSSAGMAVVEDQLRPRAECDYSSPQSAYVLKSLEGEVFSISLIGYQIPGENLEQTVYCGGIVLVPLSDFFVRAEYDSGRKLDLWTD